MIFFQNGFVQAFLKGNKLNYDLLIIINTLRKENFAVFAQNHEIKFPRN